MGSRIVLSLALLIAGMSSLIPAASAQRLGQLTGSTYSDENYGFSFEWDDDVFEGTELLDERDVAYGVALTAPGLTASVTAAGYRDVDACLTDRPARLESTDGVEDVVESRTLDPLAYDRDPESVVYEYTYTNPGTDEPADFAVEFSCEPLLMDGDVVEGVVLTYDFAVAIGLWEDFADDWIDVINSISFQDGGSNQDDANSDSSNAELDQGSYVDSLYFFSVTWDPAIYESTLLQDEGGNSYGVRLENDLEYGSIAAGGYSTPRRCLTERSDEFELIEGVTNFEEVEDLDWPETNPDSQAALYRYDYENPETGNQAVYLQYFDCQEILINGEPTEGVVLTFDMGIIEKEYEDAVPAWEDILASIEWDVEATATPDPDESSSTGVDENQYLDPEYGWGLTWDEDALTGEAWILNEDVGPIGVQLTSESGDFMTIYMHEASSERRCLTNQVEVMDGSAFTDFEEVDSVDRPETSSDARAALYEGIFTARSGDEIPIYFYAECRAMIVGGEEVEDVFLAVNLVAFVENWEGQLDLWSEVLGSIAFDMAVSGTGDDPEPNNGGNVESGIDGDTYVSALGYQLGWNDSLYTAELLDEDNLDRGITITSEGSYITVQVVGDPSLEACVKAEANILEGFDGMSPLSASREDGPTTPDDAESALFESEVEFSSGNSSDVVIYIECRPLAETDETPLFIVVSMIGFGDGFFDELPEWQAILDSIELIGD